MVMDHLGLKSEMLGQAFCPL